MISSHYRGYRIQESGAAPSTFQGTDDLPWLGFGLLKGVLVLSSQLFLQRHLTANFSCKPAFSSVQRREVIPSKNSIDYALLGV
jgi:hypothetical protein